MVKEVKFILEDGDKELILNGISVEPCLKCGTERFTCGGCKEYIAYKEKAQVLESRGIFELTRFIGDYKKNSALIKDLVEENKRISEYFKNELGLNLEKELDNIKGE